MIITQHLTIEIDKAESVYKSGEPSTKRKVEELETIVAALCVAVRALDS